MLNEISIDYLYAICALLLFLGIFASKISSWIKIPALLMILLIGILTGHEFLGVIPVLDFRIADKIAVTALVFILFSGGYDTSWNSIHKVLIPGTSLCTIGVLMTAVITGLFASWLLDLDWRFGILLGSVISSTDAAAVFAIFRSESTALKGNLRPILEYESGSNDPMASFLTLFMIDLLLNPSQSLWSFFYLMPLRICMGTLIGYLVGRYAVHLMNHVKLDFDGLYYVIGIATVFLSYSLSELLQGNGFMAVYVCGVTLGNSRFIFKHGLGRFHDGIAWLMQLTLFLTLGVQTTPSMFCDWRFVGKGLLLVAFLMLIARPLSVYTALAFSKFNFREKFLISWGGIRGAAPIVLAIFPCVAFLDDPERMAHSLKIFHFVFFAVVFSVLIQGKTLMKLAKWLKLGHAAQTKPRPPLLFEETGLSSSQMYEFEITEDSPALGMAIKDLKLPENVLVYLIRRDGVFILPRGGTIIQQEDSLLTMMEPHLVTLVEPLLKKSQGNTN